MKDVLEGTVVFEEENVRNVVQRLGEFWLMLHDPGRYVGELCPRLWLALLLLLVLLLLLFLQAVQRWTRASRKRPRGNQERTKRKPRRNQRRTKGTDKKQEEIGL